MKDFNYFKEIRHEPLRIFNMTATFYNLNEDFGPIVAEDYASALSKEDRVNMATLITAIKEVGLDVVRADVTKGMTFNDVVEFNG